MCIFENKCSSFTSFFLVSVIMNIAIHFNRKLCIITKKIKNNFIEGMLTAKFET